MITRPIAGKTIMMEYGFRREELKSDFSNFELKEIFEGRVTLNEGKSHVGDASVVRLFGFKK